MDDWRYSEERLEARSNALLLLLKTYGHDSVPVHSMKSIVGCAHDWVSGGNLSTEGLLKFYQQNYVD